MLRHGVRVLVGVRHAGIELERRVALGIAADVFADFCDPVVRGAHERANAGIVRGVQHLDDGFDGLEADRLEARLLLRCVIDAKELVVTEQDFDPSRGSVRSTRLMK